MNQALSNIRVIDMTHNQAGPACAQILAFLGADVIKLEEPKGGDVARRNMRDIKDSDSLFFLLFNANKRSLTLNLKTDEGKRLFREVIATISGPAGRCRDAATRWARWCRARSIPARRAGPMTMSSSMRNRRCGGPSPRRSAGPNWPRIRASTARRRAGRTGRR